MSEPPAQQAIARHRWTDIEDALLMEVYPRSRVVRGDLGWAEIADLMNTNAVARGIEVRRTFRENTVRSHWNDHQGQLLARYGTGGQVAAAATGGPTPASNIPPSGHLLSGEQSIEPQYEHAVTANTPPINHHTFGPVGWRSNPVSLRRPYSGWNPINRPVTTPTAESAATTHHRSQRIESKNLTTPSASRENEDVALEDIEHEVNTEAARDGEKSGGSGPSRVSECEENPELPVVEE